MPGKFVICVDGENSTSYETGYLRGIYTHEGELFTATTQDPKEAKRYPTRKRAENAMGAKRLSFISSMHVEEIKS